MNRELLGLVFYVRKMALFTDTKLLGDQMLKYMFSILLFLMPFISYGEEFVAGKDYEIIKESDTLGKTGRTVNVTEFFSFGCPWCYRVETPLNQWVQQKGSAIHYQKVPVVFNKNWEYYAKAYYIAKALAMNSTLDPVFFKAIVKDKFTLNSNQAMVEFFEKNGVDGKMVKSAFNYSPSIEMQIKTGLASMAHYHVNAVPAFVINHHYKTDLQMAKTQERLFAILDFLVKQSNQGKKVG